MRPIWLFTALLSALLIRAFPAAASQDPSPQAIASVHLARAQETRAFTEGHLQHLSGGVECAQAVYVSYPHSDRHREIVDQWYHVSQVWADLALAAPGDASARCWANRGFTFLDRLWARRGPAGGFFARSDLDGERMIGDDKWADDNSLAGVIWMEAAQRAPDVLERELMLGRARATAHFLMHGGLWDETFGGGFWWNTTKGATIEGKPAQSNGLAAAFFLQLYDMTGESTYLEWGMKTLGWLDAKLYDPRAQLYRWSVHFVDPKNRRGEEVSDWFFNYDQGILIEANLLAHRLLGGDRGHYERAWAVGRTLDPVFWDEALGGYDLQSGVSQVFPVFSAWLSQSLLALYEQDGDSYWLERAAANVDALNQAAWDPVHGGYHHLYYLCRDRGIPGCESGSQWAVDTSEKHIVDQAWMQRAQALLATTLWWTSPGAPERGRL
jgi:hypothetical protein